MLIFIAYNEIHIVKIIIFDVSSVTILLDKDLLISQCLHSVDMLMGNTYRLRINTFRFIINIYVELHMLLLIFACRCIMVLVICTYHVLLHFSDNSEYTHCHLSETLYKQQVKDIAKL